MRILGLDLSLRSTGYVLLAEDLVVWHGSVGGDKLRDVERLQMFSAWIGKALYPRKLATDEERAKGIVAYSDDQMRPDHVAVEGYSFGSHNTNLPAIGELGGVIKLAIHQAGIPLHVIPPSTWKKQLLGKGNLAKDLVRVECWKRYAVEFASQDTLDAWAVAMTLRRQLLGLDKPEPKSRRRSKDLPLLDSAKERVYDQEGASPTGRAAGAASASTLASHRR